MEITDYILAVISDNASIVNIQLSQTIISSIIKDQLPSNITIQEWNEDWCEGRDVDNSTVIRFRP